LPYLREIGALTTDFDAESFLRAFEEKSNRSAMFAAAAAKLQKMNLISKASAENAISDCI
jgi:hypothetical protein